MLTDALRIIVNKLFLKNFNIIFVNKLITFFFHKNVQVNFDTY